MKKNFCFLSFELVDIMVNKCIIGENDKVCGHTRTFCAKKVLHINSDSNLPARIDHKISVP